ncbi:hypothetical protein AXF42_Ash014868 [Apostasia shenzhenica]|uniref:Uncharacterized protein n=1 Tax=Apostasia shenzhenica TaxID=1088818 RepID=A0A2I0ALH9_9ASPA|nr:hypothetical protein AXF42_Ash014868 [Apostasia shenzhenica]
MSGQQSWSKTFDFDPAGFADNLVHDIRPNFGPADLLQHRTRDLSQRSPL